MIKTPLSTVIGGAFWTPGATIIGSGSKTLTQLIKSLFANNEQGFFYDPNDLSTMFQDAAGTIPVTAVGQPVGLIKDKSGRNNHAFQTVSASRPILQRNATTGAYYLAFDGVDDFLQTNNIDFTATDKVSLFAGVRKLSDGLFSTIAELGASDSVLGSFGMGCAGLVGDASRRTYNSNICGSSRVGHGVYVFTAPTSNVLSTRFDLSKNGAASTVMRVDCNTPQKVTENSNTGGGVYGNYPLFIGKRNGSIFPFSGHIYSLIGISRLTTDAETLALEKAIAKLIGVTLNV